jgi:hypothetical protein
MAEIIEYREKYEESWLRCRVLSFLHTAYYDDVRQKKEPYDNESIGLIAINSDEVIGLIDIELEGRLISSSSLPRSRPASAENANAAGFSPPSLIPRSISRFG